MGELGCVNYTGKLNSAETINVVYSVHVCNAIWICKKYLIIYPVRCVVISVNTVNTCVYFRLFGGLLSLLSFVSSKISVNLLQSFCSIFGMTVLLKYCNYIFAIIWTVV